MSRSIKVKQSVSSSSCGEKPEADDIINKETAHTDTFYPYHDGKYGEKGEKKQSIRRIKQLRYSWQKRAARQTLPCAWPGEGPFLRNKLNTNIIGKWRGDYDKLNRSSSRIKNVTITSPSHSSICLASNAFNPHRHIWNDRRHRILQRKW